MNLSLDIIINTILFVGAIQGLILTWFLFSVKTNRISNRLLGILTLLWSVILSVFALQSYGLYTHFPHLFKTFFILLFAWFPLLYLSVKYLFSKHEKFSRIDLLHFFPMVLVVLLNFGFYIKSAAEKLEIVSTPTGYFNIIDIISEEILSLQGIVYTLLALRIIKHYRKNIVNYQSTIDHKVISGFKTGVILAFIAWVIGIIGTHIEKFNIEIGVDLFLFVYLFFVVIIYYLSIIAIRSPEVFKLQSSDVENISITKSKNLTGLPDENGSKPDPVTEGKVENTLLEQYDKKLDHLMNDEKPFLDPDLSLQDLSEKMRMSRHQLSALINRYRNMNFYEYINQYRVNEAKNLMVDPAFRSHKIYEIAYEAGFNSKATFYRIFKQLTGQTPSDFRSGR